MDRLCLSVQARPEAGSSVRVLWFGWNDWVLFSFGFYERWMVVSSLWCTVLKGLNFDVGHSCWDYELLCWFDSAWLCIGLWFMDVLGTVAVTWNTFRIDSDWIETIVFFCCDAFVAGCTFDTFGFSVRVFSLCVQVFVFVRFCVWLWMWFWRVRDWLTVLWLKLWISGLPVVFLQCWFYSV